MSQSYLAISVPARDPGAIVPESAAPPTVTVAWLDAAGAPLGDAVALRAPAPLVAETFGGPQGPQWVRGQADLIMPAVRPESAQALRIGGPGLVTQEIMLEAATRRTPGALDAAPLVRGNPDARWRLAVVADGYSAHADFAADIDRLWTELRGARPFAALIAEQLVAVVGLFWKSSGGASLFDARPRDQNPWIIYGANEAVNEAVAATNERHDKILVVMNRPERGGAGGFGSARPSWTSNVNTSSEKWTQIALHELGHAFGLADEYVTAGNGTAAPDPLEPNVSTDPDPASVEWTSLVTVDRSLVPSLAHGGQRDFPVDAVGTFQGARYSPTDYYRPSLGCRMQWTTWEFCTICAKHIETVVRTGG